MTNQCTHGQLARSCEICELTRERDEVASLMDASQAFGNLDWPMGLRVGEMLRRYALRGDELSKERARADMAERVKDEALAELSAYRGEKWDDYAKGSEVDRLKAIVGDLDRARMDALRERNELADALRWASEQAKGRLPDWWNALASRVGDGYATPLIRELARVEKERNELIRNNELARRTDDDDCEKLHDCQGDEATRCGVCLACQVRALRAALEGVTSKKPCSYSDCWPSCLAHAELPRASGRPCSVGIARKLLGWGT